MSKYLEKNQNENDQPVDSQTNRPYVYDLFAVCNHKGQNMANGHYTGK